MPPSYRAQLVPAVPVEEMFTAYLESDATLMALAEGGIYPYTSLPNPGISRDTTPEAFDSDGYLLPIIVVKARAPIPDSRVADIREKIVGVNQATEFWLYEADSYATIDLMLTRIFNILHGYKFGGFWPTQWIYTTGPLMDDSGLSGSRMVRTDFMSKRMRQVA